MKGEDQLRDGGPGLSGAQLKKRRNGGIERIERQTSLEITLAASARGFS
jgi:hypothetical protein